MEYYVDPSLIPQRTLYTGAKMPAIGLGTFGSDHATAEEVQNAVRMAIRMGYRHFDGAACYGNEKEIGKVYKEAFDEGVVKREDLFIVSKVWNDMHKEVRKACEKTLSAAGLPGYVLCSLAFPELSSAEMRCDGAQS